MLAVMSTSESVLYASITVCEVVGVSDLFSQDMHICLKCLQSMHCASVDSTARPVAGTAMQTFQ